MTARGTEHAVVLSGGGAYGAYEVGIMKALFTGRSPVSRFEPIDAGVFCGTSVGAFNAAMMTMNPGSSSAARVAHLENIWLTEIPDDPSSCENGVLRFRGNPFRYLDPCIITSPASLVTEPARDLLFLSGYWLRNIPRVLSASGGVPQKLLQLIDLSAFVSLKPFERLIKRNLRFGEVRSSDTILKIVTTNLDTGDVSVFSNHDLTDDLGSDIIMASAAMPGVFPPVLIDGNPYVDGGVVVNTPLKYAIDAGAYVLHVVYLDPDVSSIPLSVNESTLDMLNRVYTIMLATTINEDVATVEWINDGLNVIERAARGELLTQEDDQEFIRVVAQIIPRLQSDSPYRKLTVHRYHPHDDLGGLLGTLNFDKQVITGFVQRGFDDAVEHDCRSSRCLLPQ
jgi:predicted acylesterase/phospholipase RssA